MKRLSPEGRTVAMLLGVVVTMGALAWAAVPFYDWFCRVTGFGGDRGRDEPLAHGVREHGVPAAQLHLDLAPRVHLGRLVRAGGRDGRGAGSPRRRRRP